MRKLPLRQGDKRELEDYPGREDAGPEPDQPDEVMMIELVNETAKWTGTWKAEINQVDVQQIFCQNRFRRLL